MSEGWLLAGGVIAGAVLWLSGYGFGFLQGEESERRKIIRAMAEMTRTLFVLRPEPAVEPAKPTVQPEIKH